jgi:hypothetical protein
LMRSARVKTLRCLVSAPPVRKLLCTDTIHPFRTAVHKIKTPRAPGGEGPYL